MRTRSSRESWPSSPERKGSAASREPPQDLLRTIGIHQGRRLRDLHDHAMRIELPGVDPLQDPLREVGLIELPRRQVEPDLEIDPEIPPDVGLVYELAYHPVPDLLDEPKLFGKRAEVAGRHDRACRFDPR